MATPVNALLPPLDPLQPAPGNPLLKPADSVDTADAYTSSTNALSSWLAAQRAQSSDSGLWDDAAGVPTGKGIIDASQQYAGALMAGTTSPENIAARLAKYAEKMGYDVSRDSSKLSGSEYLSLSHDSLPDALKVRVSDHNLPPSYGAPGDIDVHAGSPREQSVGWSDAVKALAGRIGVDAPSAASVGAATKTAKLQSFDGQMDLLRKTYPGEANLRTMSEMAARYEADHPGAVPWTPHFRVKPNGQ